MESKPVLAPVVEVDGRRRRQTGRYVPGTWYMHNFAPNTGSRACGRRIVLVPTKKCRPPTTTIELGPSIEINVFDQTNPVRVRKTLDLLRNRG